MKKIYIKKKKKKKKSKEDELFFLSYTNLEAIRGKSLMHSYDYEICTIFRLINFLIGVLFFLGFFEENYSSLLVGEVVWSLDRCRVQIDIYICIIFSFVGVGTRCCAKLFTCNNGYNLAEVEVEAIY